MNAEQSDLVAKFEALSSRYSEMKAKVGSAAANDALQRAALAKAKEAQAAAEESCRAAKAEAAALKAATEARTAAPASDSDGQSHRVTALEKELAVAKAEVTSLCAMVDELLAKAEGRVGS